MDSYEAWLAAMPIEDAERRVRELEAELQVMRLLIDRRRRQQPSASDRELLAKAAMRQAVPPTRRRLSRERRRILNAMCESSGPIGPAEVAEALNMEQNPIQTNMSRMAAAGIIERVGQGRYRPTQVGLVALNAVEGVEHAVALTRLAAQRTAIPSPTEANEP